MRALVTGATGCLGRNLVDRLLKDGHDVWATGRNKIIGHVLESQGASFSKTNLEDKVAIMELCRKKDIVFHCGAFSSPWGKYEDFYKANVLGTRHVVDGCLQYGVNRLVHISTSSIYFDFTERYGILESTPLPKKPVNHYVSTKLEAEHIVDSAFHNDDLPVITLRPRAIFGPHDTAIMPRIIRLAQKGGIPIFNGGNNLIDVTYVENVVEALLLSSKAPESSLGQKYNITNDKPIEFKELLLQSFQAIGIPFHPKPVSYTLASGIASLMEMIYLLPFISIEPPLTKYGVGVFALGQTLDVSAAKRDLGYKPVVSLQQGIERFSQWWMEQDHET